MNSIIRDHPITSKLYGGGIPIWIGFALAGWVGLVVVSLLVASVLSAK